VVFVYSRVLVLCPSFSLRLLKSSTLSSLQIVLGSIAIKCPGIPLSRSAYSNLEYAYKLFESVSHHNRAMKVLVSSPYEHYMHKTNLRVLADFEETSRKGLYVDE
jgi:hypothetical protein